MARRQKASAFKRQKKEAARIYKKRPSGTRLAGTFSYPATPSHATYRRFGRRRVSLPWALSMLKSRDPVMRRLASEAVATAKPSLLAKYLDEAKMGEIIRDAPGPAGNAIFRLLEKRTDREKWQNKKGHKLAGDFALEGKRGRKLLLAKRMPALATPFTKALFERARAMNNISRRLQRQFPESFVGIVVRGSTAKGYMTPFKGSGTKPSDIDSVVICYDTGAREAFVKMAGEKGIELDKGHCFINPDLVMPREKPYVFHFLFNGIFFGNRARLGALQERAFNEMPSAEWNEMRGMLMDKESVVEAGMEKAFRRFGITDPNEQRRYITAIAYRVPPPYNEMKALMEKRASRRPKN
ncbi:MAG: hypothetical protein V1493_05620 [Candidatus Diapherotrites archaeon]